MSNEIRKKYYVSGVLRIREGREMRFALLRFMFLFGFGVINLRK